MLSDPAAERAVLNGVMAGGRDAFVDVADIVEPRSFTIDSNAVLWKCVDRALQDGEVADPPAVLSAANALGLDAFFADVEERKHLAAVFRFQSDPTNLRRFAAKVRKLQVMRDAVGVLAAVEADIQGVSGDEPLDELLARLEGPINQFVVGQAAAGDGQPVPFGQGMVAHVEHLASQPVRQAGLPTGFPQFDLAIGGGLRPGVSVIACRAKGGKSTIAINIGWHVSTAVNIPVLYADLEMDHADQKNRLLSRASEVPTPVIETGTFDQDRQWGDKVRDAAAHLETIPFDYVRYLGRPFSEIVAGLRRWVLRRVGMGPDGKANPCLVMLDYLKLTNGSRLSDHNREYQELGFMMDALQGLGLAYRVPILTFVQMNKEGLEVETEKGIGGSDRIIQYCNNISILKKQSLDEMSMQAGWTRRYNRKLIPIVTRHGPGLPEGEFIHVRGEMERCYMEEGPLSNSERGFGGSDASKF